MTTKSLRVVGAVYAFLLAFFLPSNTWGQTADEDTLALVAPRLVSVSEQMDSNRQTFTNYVFWQDIPKEEATLVHSPDTTGWHTGEAGLPSDSLSIPGSGGVYTGIVDLTITYLVKNTGRVGYGGVPGAGGEEKPQIIVRYNVIGLEFLSGTLDIGEVYQPGEELECIFNNSNDGGSEVDLGFTVSFSEGWVDSNGVFIVGLEDFEGYHVFRGLNQDGSDLTNIGEMSKEEAFKGEGFDLLYYFEIIPALRARGIYEFPNEIPGLGSAIDIRDIHPNGRLGADEMMWVDTNAFNGFTYNYLVTTFDRGYAVRATSQGLSKFDNCYVTEGEPVACRSDLVSVQTELEPQRDLQEIYAVPNPYRSGSSQFTTENYHNYPDNMIRFFNVPAECQLRIFTPAGELIWERTQTDGTGTIAWDTRNFYEVEVASGVYIYRLDSASGNWMYGRIIIIR